MELRIMYPCFFGDINKIEPDYEFEMNLAFKYCYNYLFFDYDLFISEGKFKTNISFRSNELVLYRGWMLTDVQYKQLYEAVKAQGGDMIISPELYNNGHLFPNVYKRIKYYAPKTIWFKEGEKIDWDEVKKIFPKFIMKDYVKSVKEFYFPEFFDDSYSNDELDRYVNEFKKIRGNLYTGGIVLKEFVELKKTHGFTHEFRAFYINGILVALYPNSGNDKDILPLYEAQQINLYSDFYAVDFAETVDGKIIVIETGDGQVSGFLSKEEAAQVYKYLQKLVF